MVTGALNQKKLGKVGVDARRRKTKSSFLMAALCHHLWRGLVLQGIGLASLEHGLELFE